MSISERYSTVLERIEKAARRAGRSPATVQLVVVTKGHSPEAVREVVEAGARHLGENYLSEALPKIEALGGFPLTWHMIGHVQSRKARPVAEHFAWVHSVDRLKLARRLSAFAAEGGRTLPILLECNVSGEESKFGWPAWEESAWPALADELAPLLELPALEVRGLMTMAPFVNDPEEVRPVFRRLRSLRDFLSRRFPAHLWEHLSMGMSGDFEIAIEEGATFVRVGTAIMGTRRA